MNDTAPLENVKAENMDRVKSLETTIMGIGWPLKGIMTYVFYSPFLLIAYLIVYMLKRNIKKKEHAANIRV